MQLLFFFKTLKISQAIFYHSKDFSLSIYVLYINKENYLHMCFPRAPTNTCEKYF